MFGVDGRRFRLFRMKRSEALNRGFIRPPKDQFSGVSFRINDTLNTANDGLSRIVGVSVYPGVYIRCQHIVTFGRKCTVRWMRDIPRADESKRWHVVSEYNNVCFFGCPVLNFLVDSVTLLSPHIGRIDWAEGLVRVDRNIVVIIDHFLDVGFFVGGYFGPQSAPNDCHIFRRKVVTGSKAIEQNYIGKSIETLSDLVVSIVQAGWSMIFPLLFGAGIVVFMVSGNIKYAFPAFGHVFKEFIPARISGLTNVSSESEIFRTWVYQCGK